MDKAFVTGSNAYGVPRIFDHEKKSDLDLVVLVSKSDMQIIIDYWENILHGPPPQRYGDEDEEPVPSHVSLQFGQLNLIICTDDIDFETWRNGTVDLKAKAPVKRDVAVTHFRRLRAKAKASRLFSFGK